MIDFVRLDGFFPATLQLGFRQLAMHKQQKQDVYYIHTSHILQHTAFFFLFNGHRKQQQESTWDMTIKKGIESSVL